MTAVRAALASNSWWNRCNTVTTEMTDSTIQCSTIVTSCSTDLETSFPSLHIELWWLVASLFRVHRSQHDVQYTIALSLKRKMRTLSENSSDELRHWSESTNTVTNETSAQSRRLRWTRVLYKTISKWSEASQRWELFDVLLITRKLLQLFISTTSLVMTSSMLCSRVRGFHFDFCMILCLSSLSSSLLFCSSCGKIQCLETIFLTSVVFAITERRYTNSTEAMTIKKHVHYFSCQRKSRESTKQNKSSAPENTRNTPVRKHMKRDVSYRRHQ